MAIRHSTGGQYFMPTERPDDKLDLNIEANFSSVTASLRKILQMTAVTSEEKFKVLDARDKLYKIMKDKDPSLKRGALIATCPDMCPEKERLLRDYQGRGSIFEMTNFSKNSEFNHGLAVKEYARSSADQEEPLPHDLRPITVLTMTMSHLLHNVVDYCEFTDDNLEEWYMFMWDRTRALRKELTQQSVCNLESVTLVEQCARFHIHSAERLVDQDSSIYDDKINTENLTKCLQTLKYMYKDLAKEDVKCPNEPEFVCYSLLLNLNNSSVFTELSGMSSSLMTSDAVKFALDVMTAWETRNYIRFFNLVKKTTYLNCCLLRRYFGEMRLHAIKTMIRSYCTKTYSPQIVLSRFVQNLNFEGEQECCHFLSLCNFNLHKMNGRNVVNFDRSLFQSPKTTLTSGRAYLFIEEKKQKPLSVIMAGGELPPRHFENHVPQHSFTEDGDLNMDALPQSELLDLLSSPPSNNKSGGWDSKEEPIKPSGCLFSKNQDDSSKDAKEEKKPEQSTGFSSSLFSAKETKPSTTNIFGSVEPSTFGKPFEAPSIFNRENTASTKSTTSTKNIFDSSPVNLFAKNIFGSQPSTGIFGNNKPNLFSSESKQFSFVSTVNQQLKQPETIAETKNERFSTFQFKSSEDNSKEEQERKEGEIQEQEKLLKEREEEENRKRIEEEKAKMLLEKERLQEEIKKRELEKKEREKQEEEEKRRKEEVQKREAEERKRREENARQQKLEDAARKLAEQKKQEENKRRIDLEHKQKVDAKMLDLKKKIQKWKTRIILEKWRIKTWGKIEERKMKEYFKEVKLKYPPVCSEEELNGNPYGLVIPSILTFEAFHNWKKNLTQAPLKKPVIIKGDMPLLKIHNILGKVLEERAKSLKSSLDPYPWKLVISVPGESESPKYSKNIETFVEMHFVEDSQWEFGIQKGPLYCRSSSRGFFRFSICIRRVRGCKLFEGREPNPSATMGTSAVIFFMTESGNNVTRERLKAVLKSKPSFPKVPVIVISLNGEMSQTNYKKLLGLEVLERSHVSTSHLVQIVDGKDSIVEQLIKCCKMAALLSGVPSSLRISQLSDFFTGDWLDSLWRRIEISLSNFRVILQEPKVLIEFYNSCINELPDLFLDKSHDEQSILAQEFTNSVLSIPSRTKSYSEKLKSFIHCLSLPHWPVETPKSSHQLNYRIHQYCKKVVGQDKVKLKNLKWVLYRIIRRSLLWKGLDIYCDEDINQILLNFPWIQVFQEITRVLTRQLNEDLVKGKNLVVIYDADKVEKFSFESSLISKFIKKPKKQSTKKQTSAFGEDEVEESSPCLEKDSIVYAYSAAIERETSKRKREECIDESLDALFSSPAGKRFVLDEEEPKSFDFSEIKSNFESLDERLDNMKKLMAENSKLLSDIQNKML